MAYMPKMLAIEPFKGNLGVAEFLEALTERLKEAEDAAAKARARVDFRGPPRDHMNMKMLLVCGLYGI